MYQKHHSAIFVLVYRAVHCNKIAWTNYN